MSERCSCPGCQASGNCGGNSGRTDLIRRMIQSAAPPAQSIAAILAGAVCARSVNRQIEADHNQRLTADVLHAALQVVPSHVVDACLDTFLSPLGRMAVVLPGSRPGNVRDAMVRITAEIGDVARAVSEDPHAVARIRKETAEAMEALRALLEITG